jgi:predicted DNA-binding transcriptional regulator YafY
MTASQLAAELEVSQRTVLRDIEALGSAGIPVYPVRGKLGGFELIEGFTSDLPSSRLHHRPAAAPAARSTRATIWLSPRGRRLAMLLGRPAGVKIRRSTLPAAHRDGWVQAWIPVESADETVTDMLALGAEAELVDPPELRARVREAALRIAGLHGTGELQHALQLGHDPAEPAKPPGDVLKRVSRTRCPGGRRRYLPDPLRVG